MTVEQTAAAAVTAAAVSTQDDEVRPRLRLVPPHEHDWRLRDVEYAEGFCVRRFECIGCDEVDFSR